MPGALLYTNAVSDLMRDQPQIKVRVAQHGGPLVTSVMVQGEIRYGLQRLPAGKKRADLEARAQLILSALTVEPITQAMAEAYGRHKAQLDAQGVNLGDNDLWIASAALSLGMILVTRDQLLTQVPGLQVEDWTV
jgi:predicted nucleic acid-binding protein